MPGLDETQKGTITSAVSAAISYAIMGLANYSGYSPEDASSISIAAGGLLGYVLDILFAKNCFGGNARAPLSAKAAWLLRSLLTRPFFRFLVLVAIDVLMVKVELRYLRALMDNWGLRHRHRDIVAAALLTALNFHLYVNALRFGWAYCEEPNAVLDAVMAAWFGMLLYATELPPPRLPAPG